MSKSLSFCERGTNFGKKDFFCSALTRLAILIIVTFNNFFDVGVVKILVIAGLIILYFSIRY